MNTFTQTQRSEVDIRVAQELKNNQDFIYTTNQRLQSLEQMIVTLRKENDQRKSAFESAGKSFEILVENLKAIVVTQHSNTQKALNAFEFVMNVHEALINEHIVEADKKFCTKKELNEVHAQLYRDYAEDSYQLNKLDRFVQESIKIMQSSTQSALDGLRKELTPAPPSIEPLKKQVNEQLEAYRVDIRGHVKEIELLKRASHYSEKKFEALFTIVDKLKGDSL